MRRSRLYVEVPEEAAAALAELAEYEGEAVAALVRRWVLARLRAERQRIQR